MATTKLAIDCTCGAAPLMLTRRQSRTLRSACIGVTMATGKLLRPTRSMPSRALPAETNPPARARPRWGAAALFLLALIAEPECAAQTGPESRLALVIGNAAYKNSPLANPVNDARLMEAALKDSGFRVLKAENATIREMRRLVREFGDRLKASGGVGLFYFAGHGVQVNGENFLVSVDSDIRNEDEVADDAVNAQVVLEKMQSAGNRMNLIVLDACRNNPFAVKSRSAANGLATMNAPSGSLVAYATAPGSVASDGGGANGLYTQHLARAMRQPGLPVEEVFKLVRTAVRRDSRNQQTPWENTALEGQFYFKAALPPAPPVAVIPPPVPTPLLAAPSKPSPTEQSSIELALWDSVKASVATSDLQLYVDRFPSGAYVNLAKARIAALQKPMPPPGLPASEVVDPGTGRLTMKDGYTGIQTVLDVYPMTKTADATTYSSGDVIASTGQVLAVRFGPYVGKTKSGALWTLPLRSGARGRATVQIEDDAGEAEFEWRVVDKGSATGRLEVQMRLPVATINYNCQRSGLWNAQYKDDAPLPITSNLAIQTNFVASPVCGTRDRVATEWQPKP